MSRKFRGGEGGPPQDGVVVEGNPQDEGAVVVNVERLRRERAEQSTRDILAGADSFDSLARVIEDQQISIQGSAENYPPEKLVYILREIGAGRLALSHATSADGFRETVRRLLAAEAEPATEIAAATSFDDLLGRIRAKQLTLTSGGREYSTDDLVGMVEIGRKSSGAALDRITRAGGLRDKIRSLLEAQT